MPEPHTALPRSVNPEEIDDLIDSRHYRTPVGGEIEIDTGETFDSPADLASKDDMVRLHRALDRVLDQYEQKPGLRQAFRTEFVNRIEDSDDEVNIGEVLLSIPLPS